MNEYKKTLISYTHKLDPTQNSDLLNIRDVAAGNSEQNDVFIIFSLIISI